MQPLTIFLSRLIGLFAIALSLAIILHRKSFVEMASEMVRDPPLLFLVGLITLAIGLAMVLSHNIWSGGVLPIVITLFGWIQLVRGLIFLLAPPDGFTSPFEKMNFEKVAHIAVAITAVLGVYLTYMGFRPLRQ